MFRENHWRIRRMNSASKFHRIDILMIMQNKMESHEKKSFEQQLLVFHRILSLLYWRPLIFTKYLQEKKTQTKTFSSMDVHSVRVPRRYWQVFGMIVANEEMFSKENKKFIRKWHLFFSFPSIERKPMRKIDEEQTNIERFSSDIVGHFSFCSLWMNQSIDETKIKTRNSVFYPRFQYNSIQHNECFDR